MKNTDLFVLDMDGTFYLEDTLLDGSLYFLEQVKRTGKSFIFFTNNSSRAPEDYVAKLQRMNCHIERDQIITSGDVMIDFLHTYHQGKRVFLLGTPELERSFAEHGITLVSERPDLVVVGFDTTLTFEKLERACTFIREGAIFLATHPDINCPAKHGFIPDCGAICAAISASVGKQPRYVGKPNTETVEMILRRTGRTREEIAFVGDRLYTDIAAGVNNGVKGFLVLTGETTVADLAESQVKPDAVFHSLKEMGELLEGTKNLC